LMNREAQLPSAMPEKVYIPVAGQANMAEPAPPHDQGWPAPNHCLSGQTLRPNARIPVIIRPEKG